MKSLVMLEIKKVKMKSILLMGAAACGVLFLYLVIFEVLMQPGAESSVQFFSKVIAYNKMVYTLFIAILINKMFSEEIYTRSLSILFTYPIARKKLLAAKIILIVMIGLPFMFGSMMLECVVLNMINVVFRFLDDGAGIKLILSLLLSGFLQSVLGVLAAFIPLYWDVKYASTQWTLVASGIVAVFLYSMTSDQLFGVEWFLWLLAAGLGILAIKKSLSHVIEKDVM